MFLLRSGLFSNMALVVLALGAGTGVSRAQAPVKIGFVTTLSTPAGYLGEEIRNGFQVAIDAERGRLGGVPVELVIADDAAKTDIGKTHVDRIFSKDGARIFSGIVFSNIADAALPDLLSKGGFYVSANAAPNELAGKRCHPNYFVASWQAGSQSDVAGEMANRRGVKNAFLIAPNYTAGLDQIAGFKRLYKGAIRGEILTKINQTDYASEIAEIRAAKPDAIYFFLPGGMGINFIKQIHQAGLQGTALLAPMSVDDRIIESIGEGSVGIFTTSFWNWDLEVPASKEFVEAYRAKHKKVPTTYAAQGYDAARLIGSALRSVGGDVSKADAFRAALKKADFQSVRGNFRFSNNNHPIQDWYMREVVKGPAGVPTLRTVANIAKDYKDPYGAECKM